MIEVPQWICYLITCVLITIGIITSYCSLVISSRCSEELKEVDYEKEN